MQREEGETMSERAVSPGLVLIFPACLSVWPSSDDLFVLLALASSSHLETFLFDKYEQKL